VTPRQQRFRYDDSTNPPIPCCDGLVSLSGSRTRKACTFHMDTGADMTLVPATALNEHAGGVYGVVALLDWKGEGEELARTREVLIDIPGVGEYEVEAVETESVAIIGRDILNQMTICLNGPRREWYPM
jgi:hypothetical protein